MYMHYIRTRTKTNFISKNVLHHYEKEIPKIALKSPLKTQNSCLSTLKRGRGF